MKTHSSWRSKCQFRTLDPRIRKKQRRQQEEGAASRSEAPLIKKKKKKKKQKQHRSSDREEKRKSRNEGEEYDRTSERSEAPPTSMAWSHESSDRGGKKKSRTEREWHGRKWVCSSRDCSDYKDRFEVDRFDDLTNILEEDGYKGVFKGRTGDACDGCAIFWQEKQYTILQQENIEFQNFGLRNNVAQLCVLKMNLNHSSNSKSKGANPPMTLTAAASRTLLVGNIHVLFNPNRGDIKLGQIRVFLEKAHALSQEWGNIPVVLAGDLNSVPQSAIYQFLASSELDILMHDRRNISGQTVYPSRREYFAPHTEAIVSSQMSTSYGWKYRWSEEELRLAAGISGCTHLQHHLKLRSAYLGVPGNCDTRDSCGEPSATSYHSKHSVELVPVKVVETLPVSNLKKLQGLPSEMNVANMHANILIKADFGIGSCFSLLTHDSVLMNVYCLEWCRRNGSSQPATQIKGKKMHSTHHMGWLV
ncbi:carbon catabolite repressor protein 4 5 isoform X2 [Cinnamomum micranthum f. kanehirae]|uniref:Carbon catabolite repressor protein 4 5 isoform X2 n=1 Tax=Cinnamomum micranthum f. kanehirae TaxID=337451 RepID=A0A443P457_9MAGN|nr:carbon catabolite repressor protein 4 5 isoform X2 [Cinnamomum micranthum f. kanehirae]